MKKKKRSQKIDPEDTAYRMNLAYHEILDIKDMNYFDAVTTC